jgi:hypothetical protein
LPDQFPDNLIGGQTPSARSPSSSRLAFPGRAAGASRKSSSDQYDLAIVLFFKKDVDECMQLLPRYKYAAHKAKAAADLCDDGVDKFPTVFAFRHGHLIDTPVNSSTPKEIVRFVKKVTARSSGISITGRLHMAVASLQLHICGCDSFRRWAAR